MNRTEAVRWKRRRHRRLLKLRRAATFRARAASDVENTARFDEPDKRRQTLSKHPVCRKKSARPYGPTNLASFTTLHNSCRGFPSAHIYVSERPRFRQRRDLKLQSALIELEHIGGLRFDLAEES